MEPGLYAILEAGKKNVKVDVEQVLLLATHIFFK